MADLRSDGTPNEKQRELRIKELRVDLHGLEHQAMRYDLEISRWRENIAKHEESIQGTHERMAALAAEIKEIEENG